MTRFQSMCVSLSVATVLLAGLADPCVAGTILIPNGGSNFQVAFHAPIGQSFTAEDPFVFAALYFKVMNPAADSADPVRYDLYQGNGIGGALLASRTVTPTPGFLGFVDADFSLLPLVVGGQYTLVASIVGGSPYWGVQSTTADHLYAGGNAIIQSTLQMNNDMALRVTPITVSSPVPEPASLVLLGTGILGVSLRRRRRA